MQCCGKVLGSQKYDLFEEKDFLSLKFDTWSVAPKIPGSVSGALGPWEHKDLGGHGPNICMYIYIYTTFKHNISFKKAVHWFIRSFM